MSEQKTMIHDLTEGSVAKQLLKFSAPFMLSNLLQTVYSLVDMIVVGQFVGSVGLSGVTIGSELNMLFTFIAMGFATASQVMISQFVGRGDKKAISSTIGTTFTFIQSLSIVVTVVSLLLSGFCLELLNTPEEAYDYARDYVLICFGGMFFIFGYNTVSAILRGMGDSKRPLYFIGIAAVVNLILDLVFVAGLNMSAAGAAWATVIGQAFSFIVSLIYLYRRRVAFGFDFKPASFRIDTTKLKPLIKLGLPMTLQHAAISLSMLFVNSYINSYGVVASAVTGIGTKLRSLMGVVSQSVSTASSSMMGQNLAAKKYDRVRKIVRVSLTITLSFAAFVSVIVILFPEQIFSIFDTDEEVLAWAPAYMKTAVLTFFSFACMCPFNALINGMGYAKLSFVIGLMDGVVARVGLSLLMGIAMGMGIVGFWYGNALAGYVTAILAAIYYFTGRWKTHKLIIED